MSDDGILSQEEINALLNGELTNNTEQNEKEKSQDFSELVNDFEKDALGEIGNISMGTAATTLSTLLRRKVSITTPNVSVINKDKLQNDYPLPYLVVEVKYTDGLSGSNILIVKEEDASVISDLMMGGDGTCEDYSLDEIKLSAVSEAMNQMMGSATTSLSSMYDKKIDITPPQLTLVNLGEEPLELSSDFDDIVQIKFKMEIENLINSEIMQLIPIEAVKSMIGNLMDNSAEKLNTATVTEQPSIEQDSEIEHQSQHPKDVAHTQVEQNNLEQNQGKQQMWADQAYQNIPSNIKKGEQVSVQPVQFAPLNEDNIEPLPQNIGLIMDVPLDVTVELGKTRKTIKEILELNPGSIIQLDKLAGEPVDLLVNGKLIAKGEVVVIDESYGIRITTIISPMDRMNKLQ
ncbi:Flagellar motor switch protein FliN [Candidatus Syntrophocurvum alkaliphilum]|uniref:Flagellar motor switch protein FliN n=1 Tax=Candidatus Syntrophocurvum alkaliphilum TaxID=2293317 RepID=A0A6I6D7W9_9FIRM|nr:flagellar motor switch phosphatase FliY [Candidatus Syntrophocurvum alkaliphilum]QGT99176.1 Flagellar motor switch protein FliN [Candidatus Syntrophocurvum alkaliphilum]